MSEIRFGVDKLIADGGDKKIRLGLVTNDAATTVDGRPSRVALRDAGFNLVRLFGPEHGIGASAEDGAHVDDETDALTNIPVVSLYGKNFRPSRESIADLDSMLFDIPDVGARFYTYIWTLSHVLEACAEAGKPLWILDRPNPVSGEISAAEGPGLDEKNLASFVGRWDIPVRHSLTLGELATLWNAERKIGAELRVIKVEGWRRAMHWPETGLNFPPMSPAMRDYHAALLYTGTCLIEGTKLSEGRGTDAPFRKIGAPWIDGAKLAEAFNAHELPGVQARASTFVPEGRKYAGEKCGGVELVPTDPRALRSVKAGLHLVADIIRLYPREFEWLPYPTAAGGRGLQHFDRLIGRLDIRAELERGEDLTRKIDEWTRVPQWESRVKDHLLYE